ncbi:MAG: hypothetical protein U9N10_03485 [Bacillota bacterium]|nr:hypothetical protein [Bacillota bacterium]
MIRIRRVELSVGRWRRAYKDKGVLGLDDTKRQLRVAIRTKTHFKRKVWVTLG